MNIPILSIRGLAGAGKTFCAEYIKRSYPRIEILPFAYPLKVELYTHFLLFDEDVRARHAFSTFFPEALSAPSPMEGDTGIEWMAEHKAELRSFLQKWGDWRRDQDPLYFVRLWRQEYDKYNSTKRGPLLLIVDDCRYPNEYGMLTGSGAAQYYVFNPKITPMEHSSELMNRTPLGGDSFIDNNPDRDPGHTYAQLDDLIRRDFPHLLIKKAA